MDDVHGKEINLIRTTVKIPGGRPRGSHQTQQTHIKTNPNHNGEMNNLSASLPSYDDGAMVIPNASLTTGERHFYIVTCAKMRGVWECSSFPCYFCVLCYNSSLTISMLACYVLKCPLSEVFLYSNGQCHLRLHHGL